jgi:hypothetical protein
MKDESHMSPENYTHLFVDERSLRELHTHHLQACLQRCA